MIQVWDGNKGQGKSYLLANHILYLLRRNKKWFDSGRTKVLRPVVCNIKLAPHIEEIYQDYILYWSELAQLLMIREADVIMDDMATYLDAKRYESMPASLKHWFRLSEHYGVDIYGNAQDFLTIDIAVRRLTDKVYHVKKLIGSRRPYKSKPSSRMIWGLLWVRELVVEDFKKEKGERHYTGLGQFPFITRDICQVYDTQEELKTRDYPFAKHVEIFCEHIGCPTHKVPIVKHTI